ncbi:MAG: UDP-N-acetylmuramate:L-alanyl-gamma-D-glutamyl-meso-diaminopimelate ligase [Limisphaerales bacterium]|jgi:UDP-N-acetylmuramate: L-alanyl-gamma-D-glutamyl-meso-diaminopimelate ligase|nr:UDP-N-acetylmuramate:L-alanyl-gamma-D-glutamyl-meso-diaminopimelate ligase [Verrucomicrobiota bacterium]
MQSLNQTASIVSKKPSFYFAGICGTAMASVAVALKNQGYSVSGSDANIYPPMSDFLASHGIEPLPGYYEKNLRTQKPDWVVIGNALSRGNPEVEYILQERLAYTSLPSLIKNYFIRGKRPLVVCGTHGKTTTSSLLAWVFEHNGLNPSYLIGGIPPNLGQGARFTDSPWFIIEGDEYDTAFFDKRSKFIHYCPEVALLNNLEFDHADIFENLAAIKKTFRHLIQIVPSNGLVLYNGEDENLLEVMRDIRFCPVRRFGFGTQNDYQATHILHENGGSSFELQGATYTLPMAGDFNVRNALGVAACALHCGLTPAQIQSAFLTFKGIRRRMELFGVKSGVTLIDDFGHHPSAISQTIAALRQRYPNRRIWAAFEPRSNTTRRNVFQRELAEALGLSDGVAISAIAREDQLAPDERLDVAELVRQIRESRQIPAAHFSEVPGIVEWLCQELKPDDVVCIFSNGKFGGILPLLLEAL